MKRVIAAVSAVLLLGGCAGVPSSSTPATIEPLETRQANATPVRPPHLDADPRTLVESFLQANASDTGSHPMAQAYLTPSAGKGWHDDTATIVGNDLVVGTYDESLHTVTVSARVLGTLSADGVYTPNLQGAGDGGEKSTFTFHIAQIGRRFRIDKLSGGLLLTDEQFRNTYRQHVLYFFDVSESSLVPDLRWSPLDDRGQLADWLVRELAIGPRADLQTAVSLDTLPARLDVRDLNVQLGAPTLIEIPGSGQLERDVRDRLAAQLSQTLQETLADRTMSILDGNKPVLVPSVASTEFSAADFSDATGPAPPPARVFYLNGGQIRTESGRSFSAAIPRDLSSFAVGQPRRGSPLFVAGVVGTGAAARLEVGTERNGLRPTSVQGRLSRPAFVPGRAEVWVGADSRLYRVTIDEGTPHVYPVQLIAGGGRIAALRLSPEGSRVAIVVSGGGGSMQLYVGSVVRGVGSPTAVRVDSLRPISPQGVAVRDVAWLDSFKLFAIGNIVGGTQDARTFETGVDGTDWSSAPLGNLPGPPDAVTAATAASAWVSANGYVWVQSGSSWVGPGPTGQTPGNAPVYLE